MVRMRLEDKSKCLIIWWLRWWSPMQGIQFQSLGREDPLEKGMATHSSIPPWRIPWTEKPGGLQSTGSQQVRQNWATNTSTFKNSINNKYHSKSYSGYFLLIRRTETLSGPFLGSKYISVLPLPTAHFFFW